MFIVIKKFLRVGGEGASPELRRKLGATSGFVGVFLNILLFGGKLTVALISGSVAIIADAFNNLSDAGSSLVTLVGFRMSGKKPDPEHPFGHGRLEYVTGFIVSVLIILMGFELGISSVKSIGAPEPVAFSTLTIIVLCASVAVKLYMALYNFRLYRALDSATLKATALDSVSDAVATSAVLITLLISKFTAVALDGWAGLMVSGFILYTGIASARETLEPLLGKPPKKQFVDSIRRIVMASPNVVGMHDLVVHDYGPGRLMITLHAEIPSELGVFAAHEVVDDLENALESELGCEAVIHFDPVDMNDENLKRMRGMVDDIVRCVDERLTIHDFRYVPGEGHTNLLFDVVVPFDIALSDETIRREICDCVKGGLPNHYCVMRFDRSKVE